MLDLIRSLGSNASYSVHLPCNFGQDSEAESQLLHPHKGVSPTIPKPFGEFNETMHRQVQPPLNSCEGFLCHTFKKLIV
jgi:hypothetical protein